MPCMVEADAELAACGSVARRAVVPVTVIWTIADRRARELSIVGGGEPALQGCVASRIQEWDFPVAELGPMRWTFLYGNPGAISVIGTRTKSPVAASALFRIEPEGRQVRIMDTVGRTLLPGRLAPGAYDLIAVFAARETTPIGSITVAAGDEWVVRCALDADVCRAVQLRRGR